MNHLKYACVLTVAAACLSGNAWSQEVGKVHLKGQLIDMGTTDVPMRYDGAASMLGGCRDIMLTTDAEGHFEVTFALSEPAYYNICRNTLYLTPGDDLTVRITQENLQAEFEGRGAEANVYMKERLFPHGGSFLDGGSNVRADFAATHTVVDSLARIRRAQLDALTGVSADFKELEHARINADVLNSYLSYPAYSNLTAGLKDRRQIVHRTDSFFHALTSEVQPMLRSLENDKFLDVNVVRGVLSEVNDSHSRSMKAWTEGCSFTPRLQALFRANGWVNTLRNGVTEETLAEAKAYADNLPYKDFSAELDKIIAKAGLLLKGQPAIDFVLTDTAGVAHRLSEFKGKVIYLDFWATWCGPCIQESPHFEALSREFVGKDIVFLPISTDTNRRAWLRFITTHKKELVQYNGIDTAMRDGWSIHYIPRFVLIDKDFNIVSAYAPRPSDPEAKAMIESLL